MTAHCSDPTNNDDSRRAGEDEFLTSYDQSKYPSISYTADLCVFTRIDNRRHILLVERGNHPFMGTLALPGGFVDPNESSEEAAVRELAEETSVSVSLADITQLRTYSNPNRDPRGRMVSTAYVIALDTTPTPTARDDARTAEWWPVEDLHLPSVEYNTGPHRLAFDHTQIITDALTWLNDNSL